MKVNDLAETAMACYVCNRTNCIHQEFTSL